MLLVQCLFVFLPVLIPQLRSPFSIGASLVLFLTAKLFPYIVWYRHVRTVRRLVFTIVRGEGMSDTLISKAIIHTHKSTVINGSKPSKRNATGTHKIGPNDGKKGSDEGPARLVLLPDEREEDSSAYCSRPFEQSSLRTSSSSSSSSSSPNAHTCSKSSRSIVVRLKRRAIVVVGGDFARSPRMQYHSVSLSDAYSRKGRGSSNSSSPTSSASSVSSPKLFDSVLLVGYDCGNSLSEEIQKRSILHCQGQGDNNTIRGSTNPSSPSLGGISLPLSPISTDGLFLPPSAPEALLTKVAKIGGRKAAWAVGAMYKVVALSALLVWRLPRLVLPHIEIKCVPIIKESDDDTHYYYYYCDIVVPQLVLCQTPPAIPFIPIIKFITDSLSIIPDVEGRWAKLLAIECGPSVEEDSTRNANKFSAAHVLRSQGAPQQGRRERSDRREPSSSLSLTTAFPMWLSSFKRPALAVDWHNFGYTIMREDKRPSWMVRVYKAIEKRLCRGTLNLTVSKAMKKALTMREEEAAMERRRVALANGKQLDDRESSSSSSSPPTQPLPADIAPFGFPSSAVRVLYDHSPQTFKPIDAETFLREVMPIFEEQASAATATAGCDVVALHQVPSWVRPMMEERVRLELGTETTHTIDNKEREAKTMHAFPKEYKGRIIVASTSWTADDDYTIVVEALKQVDEALIAFNSSSACEKESDRRYVWFVATGKGVSRAAFERQVLEADFSPYLRVSAVYFQSMMTYARMLGGADVGLSLHFSSCGLDLPMKCVDMLGAGLPVLALRYLAIGELIDVENGVGEGWLFSSKDELAGAITRDILGIAGGSGGNDEEGSGWRRANALLASKRSYVASRQRKWDQDWLSVAQPAIEEVLA